MTKEDIIEIISDYMEDEGYDTKGANILAQGLFEHLSKHIDFSFEDENDSGEADIEDFDGDDDEAQD